MAELRVHDLSLSLDGFAAGPSQTRDDPLGRGGERLHDWAFGDATDVDRAFRARGTEEIGATIMGRNMFGPVRGSWDSDPDWRGWWGEDPPLHHDVFVLTHHARPPLTMAGGTTFTFVTEGIETALERAFAAARGADVRLGGGPSTIRQYAAAGLIDEVHVVVVPVLLGGGERLFEGTGWDGWRCVEFTPSSTVAHVRLRRDA